MRPNSYGMMLTVLIMFFCSMGCGDSRGHRGGGVSGISSQSYTVSSMPLDSVLLKTRENVVYKMQIAAIEDTFFDRIAVKFHSTDGLVLESVEMRETSNAAVLPNSIRNFPTPPTFPLEMSIVMNRAIPRGTHQTFVVVCNLRTVPTGSTLRMDLVNIFGRSNGQDIAGLTNPMQGQSLAR